MQLSDRVNLILDAYYCRRFRLPKPIAMSLGWKLISSDLSSLDQEDRNYLNHHDYDLDQRRHCREVCIQPQPDNPRQNNALKHNKVFFMISSQSLCLFPRNFKGILDFRLDQNEIFN